ncbi:unnamed protein product [Kuraishia capsulata CBS 1993]|uniref:Histone transcription regulator 3 homolog n=1 Tax=Kuraishia capsulata CBS 1993 TaxID=1382522 RepID=W6MVI4_9ASCO|nr:uncharacterized protein KUCA_T00005977001 [Kuraishia capsulata CBS 1993]CDK29982.1 unnamed protein product [Kuraishia capsulata CBS 1993]
MRLSCSHPRSFLPNQQRWFLCVGGSIAMSTFTALNLSEDEVDAEDHTRELQIEESFKIFQRALQFQKNLELDKAEDEYTSLFALEVVSGARTDYLSPTIQYLKYLCYRNRGLFRFSKFVASVQSSSATLSLDPVELRTQLLTITDDLVTALEYGEGDTILIDLLYGLYKFFDDKKLERFAVEYELMKFDQMNGSDDEIAIIRASNKAFMLPHTLEVLNNYKSVLDSIGDYDFVMDNQQSFMARNKICAFVQNKPLSNSNLAFLQSLKDKLKDFRPETSSTGVVDVEIALGDQAVPSWNNVLEEIQNILPKPRGRAKCFDNYLLTADPVEKIRFKILDIATENEHDSHAEEMEVDKVPETTAPEVSEPTKAVEAIPDQDVEMEAAEEPSTRASKRRTRGDEDPVESGDVKQNQIFDTLNAFLALLQPELRIISPLDVLSSRHASPEDKHIEDFANMLSEWTGSYSNFFLMDIDTQEGEEFSVAETLTSNNKNSIGMLSLSIDDMPESQATLKVFIDKVNSSNVHIAQLRVQLLELLFVPFTPSGPSPIVVGKLDPEAFSSLKMFLDSSDIIIYESIQEKLTDSSRSDDEVRKGLFVCTSIIEILVDSFISLSEELKSLKTNEKLKTSDLSAARSSLSARILRWSKLLEDLKSSGRENLLTENQDIYFRQMWSHICFMQFDQPSETSNVVVLLHRLKEEIQKLDESLEIPYTNHERIPKLNLKSTTMQLSKISVTGTFANITDTAADVDSQKDDKMRVLKSLLIPSESEEEPSPELSEMRVFLNDSSLELKLKLWLLLLRFYSSTDSFGELKLAFEAVVSYSIKTIKSKYYTENIKLKRHQMLMTVMSYFGLFSKIYTDAISKQHWKEFSIVDLRFFSDLLELVRLVHVFALSEDSANMGSHASMKKKSKSSFVKLADNFSRSYSIFGIYFLSLLPEGKHEPEVMNDFLSIIHELLGSRGMCDSGEGAFLDLAEHVLLALNWPQSDRDVFQIINCRYHINVAVDLFVPADHHTEKIELSSHSALALSQFVLPCCFKKRNPMFNIPKNDMKALLDALFSVIGDPDMNNEITARNLSSFDYYLNLSEFNMRLVRLAFNGLLELDLAKPRAEYQPAAEAGLYYVQGVLALNLFKIRKRAMQGRSTELEAIVKMFSAEILCGTKRVETWLLLAQTYAFLVEDDVIWTSDKLSNPEKKNVTAIFQKKSLLCYLMAINLYVRSSKEQQKILKPVSALLWSSFSKELYNATFQPMMGLAFSVRSVPIFVRKESGKTFENAAPTGFTTKNALSIMEASLSVAIQKNPKDWSAYYYLSKVQYKLGRDASTHLESLLQACRLAKTSGSSADPIIEPQARLPWLIFKMVMKQQIQISGAIEFLERVFPLPVAGTEIVNFSQFSHLILDLLKLVKQADKKNWQHKPYVGMAKIYFSVLHDTESAKAEMSSIMNLKPNVRTLVTIWKPENERPGKHFVYVYDYIVYYAEILFDDKDLESLFIFAKKLRRLGSSMVSQAKAWDQVVLKVCTLVKWLIDVPPKYTEIQTSDLSFQDFMETSLYLLNSLKTGDIPSNCELLYYLFSEMHEFRKMTNGFAPTGLVDDTYYAVYFSIFNIYKKELAVQSASGTETPSILNSPQAGVKKARVARRDVVPIGNDVMTLISKRLEKIRTRMQNGGLTEVIKTRAQVNEILVTSPTQELTPLKEDLTKESTDVLMRHAGMEIAKSKLAAQASKMEGAVTVSEGERAVQSGDIDLVESGKSEHSSVEKDASNVPPISNANEDSLGPSLPDSQGPTIPGTADETSASREETAVVQESIEAKPEGLQIHDSIDSKINKEVYTEVDDAPSSQAVSVAPSEFIPGVEEPVKHVPLTETAVKEIPAEPTVAEATPIDAPALERTPSPKHSEDDTAEFYTPMESFASYIRSGNRVLPIAQSLKNVSEPDTPSKPAPENPEPVKSEAELNVSDTIEPSPDDVTLPKAEPKTKKRKVEPREKDTPPKPTRTTRSTRSTRSSKAIEFVELE